MSKPVAPPGTDRQVLIETRALALPSSIVMPTETGHVSSTTSLYAGSAVVKADATGYLSVGDEVIFFIDLQNLNTADELSRDLALDRSMVFKRPSALSFAQAAWLAACYLRATASACAILGVTPEHLFDDSDSDPDDRKILLLGGTTPMGSALLQILHAARPNLFILTTIGSLEHTIDEDTLIAYGIEQIQLGAKYAIDHAAGDLLVHLQSALEEDDDRTEVHCIADAFGRLGGRGREFQDLISQFNPKIVEIPGTTALASRPSSAGPSASSQSPEDTSTGQSIGDLAAHLERLLRHNHYRIPTCVRIEEHQLSDWHQTAQISTDLNDGVPIVLNIGQWTS